jgi:hypothetical protein
MLQHVHTKLLMQQFASDCDLLQNRKKQTQNPPTLAVMGVRPPLPAPKPLARYILLFENASWLQG